MIDKSCDCGQKFDLRPYGPNGKWVCFQCAFSTPDAKAETERNFVAQLESASNSSNMVMLSEVGPVPILPHQSKLH